MKEISRSIEINAPLEKVWDTFNETKTWESWNKTMKASGEFLQGNEISLSMLSPKGEEMNSYKAKLIQVENKNKIVWKATMGAGFIFTNLRTISFESKGSTTIFTQTEGFKGIMAIMMASKFDQFVGPTLEAMNSCLKNYLEKG